MYGWYFLILIDTFYRCSIIKYTNMAEEIKPNEVYTTKESQDFLRVSNSTIKRFLKKGILKANKVGGRYRVLGRELLRLVSPGAEEKAVLAYRRFKNKAKKKIEKW